MPSYLQMGKKTANNSKCWRFSAKIQGTTVTTLKTSQKTNLHSHKTQNIAEDSNVHSHKTQNIYEESNLHSHKTSQKTVTFLVTDIKHRTVQ